LPPSTTPVLCLHTGDVTLDAEYSAVDAQMAFYIAVGTYTPTYQEFCAADCNADGLVTAGDAGIIFAAIFGQDHCAEPLLR